jgi:hypothetical protein
MNIVEYIESVKHRLLTDSIVTRFHLVRERIAPSDGHMRARLMLIDGSRLEFSEYTQRSSEGQINVVTYSYHWADSQGNLIRRWDNTPHFPDLPGFPHHIHDGSLGTVLAGYPVNIFAVLDEIAQSLT